MSAVMESLVRRYDAIKPHLTERQRRVWLGSEARELGSGGVGIVWDAVGIKTNYLWRCRAQWFSPELATVRFTFGGNPALKPEKANQTVVGAVWWEGHRGRGQEHEGASAGLVAGAGSGPIFTADGSSAWLAGPTPRVSAA